MGLNKNAGSNKKTILALTLGVACAATAVMLIAARKPAIVVAGHMTPQSPTDLSGVEHTKAYLIAFEEELAKAKRYLAGGLELRMDDTRHVASWIGGQEALHDRVLTLEEALAEIAAVDAAAVQQLAGQIFCDEGLRLSAVAPARYLRGLEPRLRLPA